MRVQQLILSHHTNMPFPYKLTAMLR